MRLNDYQELASRTMNKMLPNSSLEHHALHGIVGEVGEIHSLFQKHYQGHAIDETKLKLELGDLLWFVSEFATVNGWSLNDIAQMNIDKLKSRYPDGFEEERSLNRSEGDV